MPVDVGTVPWAAVCLAIGAIMRIVKRLVNTPSDDRIALSESVGMHRKQTEQRNIFDARLESTAFKKVHRRPSEGGIKPLRSGAWLHALHPERESRSEQSRKRSARKIQETISADLIG